MQKPLLGCLFALCASLSAAQSTFVPQGSLTYHYLDRLEIKSGALTDIFFTSVKPFERSGASVFADAFDTLQAGLTGTDRMNLYYLYRDNQEWSSYRVESKQPMLKYFYKTPADFFTAGPDDVFMLKVNPVMFFQYGREKDTAGHLYINTRGAEVRGWVGKKVGFYSFLGENQARYPRYVREKILAEQAVPGEGFYKEFKSAGVDYFTARGYITFPVIKQIAVQLGHDKHFIGNGYRSLFLSDNSTGYFFLRFNTRVWKLNYQNLFTEMVMQYPRGADTLLPRKYAAFHHLSYNAARWLNVGFFEGVVFSRKDHFELHYLTPVIFYRSIEQHLGSPDNSVMGIDCKANLLRSLSLYGQVLLDEFNFRKFRDSTGWWGNKYGLQAGAKYVDVAGIGNLDAQAEVNMVMPYTYSHRDEKANYTHYNQPFAHPLGANFAEAVAILRYQPAARMWIEARMITAVSGTDTSGSNWGGNIFLSYNTRQQEYNNSLAQGVRTRLLTGAVVCTYQWKHNVFFDLLYRYRQLDSVLEYQDSSTHFLALAFRMNMQRRYDDF